MRDRTTFPQLRYHEIFAGEEHGHQIYQPELNLRLSVRLQEKWTRTGKLRILWQAIDNGNGDQPHKAGKKDRKSDEYVFPLFFLLLPRECLLLLSCLVICLLI